MISAVDDDNTGTLRYREFINMLLIEEKMINEPLWETSATGSPVKRNNSKGDGELAPVAKLGRGRARHGALKKKKRGYLNLDIKLGRGPPPCDWQLTVTVVKAKELLPMDLNGLSDPYVKLYVEPDPKKETKKKTNIIKKDLNPVFQETFFWTLSDIKVNIYLTFF
jgi:hypothetical protein